ncbi:MAG: sulfite exporter TauE/SafE family protein [Gallionella sp.]|nr:sulfite exporter TauE/SafE family protein [Gallionella sp.]
MIDINMVVSTPMAAALGFAYGMGPCLISCAPFLGPVFLASDGGIKKSWKIILPLSLGRLTAYSTFGFVVGMAGHYVKGAQVTDSVRLVVGVAVLMMGVALLLRKPKQTCATTVGRAPSRQDVMVNPSLPILRRIDKSDSARTLMPGGLFLMGVGMTLTACAPLGIVLFSAAMSGSAWNGLLLACSFGLGAIVVPAIFFGIGMAYLGTQLREQLNTLRPAIERLSAILLVLVGISNIARW